MQRNSIGKSGVKVSRLGLGCMGMSEFYGNTDDALSVKVILKALESGITMLDTADIYGSGHNEELISRAIRNWKDDVFISTKFGIVRKEGSYERIINGKPDYVKKACEESLRRLKREYIDLYYIHRIDVTTPIEDTVAAMADLVKAGKVRFLGISEASPETIKRAHSVHPLTALQSEYSLWTRDIERKVLPCIRSLGIALVAYSPLGRGFLSGKIKDTNILDKDDFRLMTPRFKEENFRENLKLLQYLEEKANQAGITPAQLALSWLIHQGEDVFPIPGTRNTDRLLENIAAAVMKIEPAILAELSDYFLENSPRGSRYPETGMAGIDC